MESTKNFSVRTTASVFHDFTSIVQKQNLTRNGVIQKLMTAYVEKHKKDIPSLRLHSDMAKYRGVAKQITEQSVGDEPRLRHFMGYE